ncbi:hypothetical protein QZH41_020215 [Actinostola sp. cb2023]|nr:hypothetical protein QZH41_020215 [Actinostola sp. cb2023]
MLKMADDNEGENPSAATILRRDRYMDDLIHSCSNPQSALDSIQELDRVLATGSFKIKEWLCSSEVVLKGLPKAVDAVVNVTPNEAANAETSINLDGEKGTKTLGVGWNPETDVISFDVKAINIEKLTKRTVLSSISKLYDPLGLASAVTIKARIALQDVWRAKEYDWDDPLPDDKGNLWMKLLKELERLKEITFPRCLQPECVSGESELHVFADASGVAYGAVSYLLWPTPHGPEVRLIAAKARVASLRQNTIPRLELMAALIASRLASLIYAEFKTKPSSVTLWSDSKIVLHWICSESALLKAFVGVRVTEIQTTWDPSCWRFVPTDLNPADDLSRGLPIKELRGRWMNGPPFLKKAKEEWPAETKEEIHVHDDPERKKPKTIGAVNAKVPLLDSSAYSSWSRLVRITAYVTRFVHNVKVSKQNPTEIKSGPLEPEEIKPAEHYWIRQAQADLVDWEDKYKDLAPFIKEEIIRVGGRLKRSQMTYDQTHPILLPAKHHISYLIMKETHNKVAHAGCERTLSESRRQYWIVRGRGLAKKIARNCVTCRKQRQPPHSTLMADLPQERLKTFSPPFSVTGVDLFGPFSLKFGRNKSSKAWGAIFTCATTRAVHLEIVESSSSESFIQALRRFASHHGWPSTVISDNGKSFVGAEAELRKLVVEGRKQINDFAVLHKIRWIFTTPLSPHQGGIYESLIKQTKKALRVTVGNQVLSWNEMSTVFAEVKSLVNSRPLGHASNDPNDPQPLTPNHFILGRASADIPQGPFQESRNLRKRFQFVQTLTHHFWKAVHSRVSAHPDEKSKVADQAAPSDSGGPSSLSGLQRSSWKMEHGPSQGDLSSSARRNALADIAAARKQAEYDKLIAKKDNARKMQQAQYELEMAKLVADKVEAIASARLLAIEECLDEEEFKDVDIPADPDPEDHVCHVNTWVQNHPITNTTTPGQEPAHRPIVTSTPKRDSTIGLLETFTITNQRLVSGLTL